MKISVLCEKSVWNKLFQPLLIVCISGCLLLSMVCVASGQERLAGIHELNASLQKFLDKKISVHGRLLAQGSNYYTDPGFVVEDGRGETIEVSPWLPLETPPPIPGRKHSLRSRPSVMSDMLGRKLLVSGTVRFDRAKGRYYMEVESAVEDTE